MKKSFHCFVVTLILLEVCIGAFAGGGKSIEETIGVRLSQIASFGVSEGKIVTEKLDMSQLDEFYPSGANFFSSGSSHGGNEIEKYWEGTGIRLEICIYSDEDKFTMKYENSTSGLCRVEVVIHGSAIECKISDESEKVNMSMTRDNSEGFSLTLGTGKDKRLYTADSFSSFRTKYTRAYRKLAEILKEYTLVKAGSFETSLEEVELGEGECFVLLSNGSRIKGKIDVREWILKTAYGELTIPSVEMEAILIGQASAGEDEVNTVRLRVPGELKFEHVVLSARLGTLTIPKSDIREIIFANPRWEDTFLLKPDEEWLETGIMLGKEDRLRLEAGMLGDGARLVCRVGKEEFEVGPDYDECPKKEGQLSIRLEREEGSKETAGECEVRIIVGK